MANRVQVELGAKVQGFVDGMNQASESAKQYETDTRRVKDSLGNFRKEFSQAKRDVQNLAAAYAKLDSTARASQFGQEMKKQLDAAKEAAAQYVDMQGDLNQELKNMASDTRVLDTLAEGMGVVGDITSSTLGIIAQFTGNEEDARRAIVAFTTAQAAVGTVTKIANALQAQSNTMLAIAAVRNKAAAAAASVKAAAEGKGVVVTKAATVAQAAFNKVAMANPYVLLAMAVLTVVSALGTFIVWSKKAEAQEKAEAKAAEQAKSIKEAYYNSYNQKLGETMSSYSKLQQEWKNLKSESEKNQWIKDNKDAFHELGYEINNTADAEKFFVQNEAAVIASFTARAEAAAYAAQQVEIFNQALKDSPKAGDKMSVKEAAKYGISEKGHKVDTHLFDDNEIELTEADEKKIREIKLKEARKTSDELGKERIAADKKANEAAAKTGVKQYNKTREAELKKTKKSSTPKTKVEIEIEKGSLQESENKLKKLEEIRSKMSISNPDLPKIQQEIEKVKKEIEAKKIKLGIEKPKIKTDIDVLSDYEKQLKLQEEEATAALVLAHIHQKDANEIVRLTDEWEKATKARKDYDATKKAITEESPTVTANKKYSGIMRNETPKTVKDYQDAINTLQDRLNSIDTASAQEQFTTITDKIKEMQSELDKMQDYIERGLETPTEKAAKKAKKLADRYNLVADAVASVGDAFSSLSELAEDDPTLQIIGIVAQAVANMFAGYAQATVAAAQTGNPWVWAAFAAAGLAQTLAMVAQIKSAAQFAEGGIVGGSSYSGDRINARLNSGEMVLNKRQQKNLFDLLDQDVMPQKGGTNVTVTGVIRGTDLLLVQKNTNKVRSKAGTQISF